MTESILLNKYEMVFSHFVNLKIGGGSAITLALCKLIAGSSDRKAFAKSVFLKFPIINLNGK
jgi:hypothetical protein